CYSLLAIQMPVLMFGASYMAIWLFAFAAGMLLAHKPIGAAFSDISDKALWALVLAFVLCRMFISMNSIIAMIAQILLASFLVGSIYYGRPDRTFVKLLHHPYIQFLGKTSYSLYLLNVPLLLVALSVIEPFNLYSTHAVEVGLLVGALVTIAT